jgi:hypothetical protein
MFVSDINKDVFLELPSRTVLQERATAAWAGDSMSPVHEKKQL